MTDQQQGQGAIKFRGEGPEAEQMLRLLRPTAPDRATICAAYDAQLSRLRRTLADTDPEPFECNLARLAAALALSNQFISFIPPSAVLNALRDRETQGVER